MEHCTECARLTSGNCGRHMSSAVPTLPTWTVTTYGPPPVCTGSHTVPPGLHGQSMSANLVPTAKCGICGGTFPVAWTTLGPQMTVHPYLVAPSASPGEST